MLAVAAKVGYYPGFVWAPVNPYILEGIKTTSYEIAAQLPGAPDVLVAPVGGGEARDTNRAGNPSWMEL